MGPEFYMRISPPETFPVSRWANPPLYIIIIYKKHYFIYYTKQLTSNFKGTLRFFEAFIKNIKTRLLDGSSKFFSKAHFFNKAEM